MIEQKCLGKEMVSISSPSSEGGGVKRIRITPSQSQVSISSPSSEGGGSSVFKPRHSKTFRPPNIRTPLMGKSTWQFLPK